MMPGRPTARAPGAVGDALERTDVAFDREATGSVLTTEESECLLRLSRMGLEALQGLPAEIETSTLSQGIEHEWVLVDQVGDPLPIGPRLKEQMEVDQRSTPDLIPGNWTGEYARYNIESNFRPLIGFGGDFLREMEEQYLRHIGQLNERAGRLGGQLVSAGIVPSIREKHLSPDWIWPNPRYQNLEAGIRADAQRNPRDYRVTRATSRGVVDIQRDKDGLHFRAPGIDETFDTTRGEMVRFNLNCTSVQFHWGVADQANYVRDHRIADLISAVLVGVSANSPIVREKLTGPKDNRLFISCAMLHSKRVLPDGWIGEPLGQLAAALKLDPILAPAVGGKELDQPLTPVRALREHHKTTWPINRTVFEVINRLRSEAGLRVVTEKELEKLAPQIGDKFQLIQTLLLRVENRPVSAGPTALDNVANAALFYGLMAGMPSYLEGKGIDLGQSTTSAELEKILPFARVNNNVGLACADGLQAQIRWLGSEKVSIVQLLNDDLLDVARFGLRELGVPAADIQRYLGVIERRVQAQLGGIVGVCPADIASAWYRSSTTDPRETCQQITRAYAAMLRDPDTDILRWFTERRRSLLTC